MMPRALPRLVGPGEQVAHRDPERAGQADDGLQARFAPSPLEEGDLGPVHRARLGQRLLGEPPRSAHAAQVGGEACDSGHGRRIMGRWQTGRLQTERRAACYARRALQTERLAVPASDTPGRPPEAPLSAGGDGSRSRAMLELLDRWRLAARRDRIAVGRQLGLDPTETAALWALTAVGAPTPGTLRRQLLLTSGGVAALIGRLERRGVLTRERHPSDGRSVVLRVAPSFLERARALLAPLGRAVDTVAAALDESERRGVASCLKEIAASIEAETDRLLGVRDGESCAVQRGGPVPALWA